MNNELVSIHYENYKKRRQTLVEQETLEQQKRLEEQERIGNLIAENLARYKWHLTVTRKNHKCQKCKTIIPKGTRCFTRRRAARNVFEATENFKQQYQCTNCHNNHNPITVATVAIREEV